MTQNIPFPTSNMHLPVPMSFFRNGPSRNLREIYLDTEVTSMIRARKSTDFRGSLMNLPRNIRAWKFHGLSAYGTPRNKFGTSVEHLEMEVSRMFHTRNSIDVPQTSVEPFWILRGTSGHGSSTDVPRIELHGCSMDIPRGSIDFQLKAMGFFNGILEGPWKFHAISLAFP